MPETITGDENIASYCLKCKLTLDHELVAMDGGTVSKVKCKTCGSVHKFKDPADVKKKRAVKKQEDAVKTAETLWETSLSETKGKERMYDMSGKYRVGDIVLHSTFGKGIVRKLYLNKCDVLFKDKERLMASTNQ